MKKQDLSKEDDGRVIANMNVEGMPWYVNRGEEHIPSTKKAPSYRLTKSETRRFTWYAILAGLTIVGIYAVVWVLFTLFATQVWFK